MTRPIEASSLPPRVQTNECDFPSRSKSTCSLNQLVSPTHSFASSRSDISLNQYNQRRFHSSQLGKPPGLNTRRSSMKLATLSTTKSQITPKIAPMKEVEKMISDLKKENFDLKLRLYHLEDLLSKDFDVYQLNQENYRLRMTVQDRNDHVEKLERQLLCTNARHMGTQTMDSIADTPTTQASFHTAFESTPEAFGLKSNIQKLSSWKSVVANEDHLNSVVHSLQQFNISSKDHDIFDSWLHQNVNHHQQGRLRRPMV